MSDPAELVRAHLRAEDDHDVEAVLATFTEDCVYQIPAYGIDLRGKAAVGAYYSELFATFSDFVNLEVRVHPSTEAVFVEVTTERTHEGSFGGFAATGRSFRTTSLAQFPLSSDGLLGGEIVHVDPLATLLAIGAVPNRDLFALARRATGSLAGRSALVTGASGGIGAAIAAALGAEGARLVLAGRDAGRLERSAEQAGAEAVVLADLADLAECRRVASEAAASLGGIDVLVNAAGGTIRGPALQTTEADWDVVMSTNLKSVFFLCQSVGAVMTSQRSGSVVNVASLNGVVGNAWAAGYAASKGGLVQLTKSLALEWAPYGVRVNAIGPGFIATEMTAPLFADGERSARILGHIPLERFGRPEDLGGAAVFLASDAASYVTGQVLYVDGGYLCV